MFAFILAGTASGGAPVLFSNTTPRFIARRSTHDNVGVGEVEAPLARRAGGSPRKRGTRDRRRSPRSRRRSGATVPCRLDADSEMTLHLPLILWTQSASGGILEMAF